MKVELSKQEIKMIICILQNDGEFEISSKLLKVLNNEKEN